jgi:hypothetical protein
MRVASAKGVHYVRDISTTVGRREMPDMSRHGPAALPLLSGKKLQR